MRAAVVGFLAVCVVLTASGQQQEPLSGARVSPAVRAALAEEGAALVFVEVDAPFVPEGHLATPTDVSRQRLGIASVVERLQAGLDAAGIEVDRRFEAIPFFTASVTHEQLASLATLPGVVSVTPATLGGVVLPPGAGAADERPSTAPALARTAPFIDAPAAWAAGARGTGWSVAVVGTGVDRFHPFLTGKVTREGCFSAAGGSANPSQFQSLCPGGVPVSTAAGSAAPCSPITDCWTGTFYAGVAVGGNGPALYPNGVAPGANAIALQMLTRATSSTVCGSFGAATPCLVWFTVDAVAALNHVLALAGPGNAGRIASVFVDANNGRYLTQAACDADYPSLKAAIDNLRSLGIATTPGAGSWGYTNALSAPGCISSAVGIGASTSTDTVATFSSRAPFLPLMAPGYPVIYGPYPGNGTAQAYGTGPAAVHVLGAWAVLRQAAPHASVGQILAALQATGVPVVDTAVTPNITHRRLRVNAARLALLGGPTSGPPGPPGTARVSGNGNAVDLNWEPPLTGGAPAEYTVVARQRRGGPVIATLPVGGALRATAVAPDGVYVVTVRATNAAGSSVESDEAVFAVPILPPLPGAPQALSVAVAGSAATFTWQPPPSGGPVSSYALVASVSPGGTPVASVTAGGGTHFTVSGISPGTYYVRVVAQNAAGFGPPSDEIAVVVAPPTLPGAPSLSAAQVAGTLVTLAWTQGPGGFPDAWIVSASLAPGGPTVAALQTTVPTLSVHAARGRYFVKVSGVNALGTGPTSNEIEVVVP
jgi:hypothetical protein